jgi:hypothetical protein
MIFCLPEDLQKLYVHDKFSLDTTESLQKRVFFEYMYYFCNRGRENIRDVQKEALNIVFASAYPTSLIMSSFLF